jgi:extracellular elastinolytic metalloproteinase
MRGFSFFASFVLFFCFSSSVLAQVQEHDILKQYLDIRYAEQNRPDADYAEWTVSSSSYDKRTSLHHFYLQQRHRGVDIWNAMANVVLKNNRVVYSVSRFEQDLVSRVVSVQPSISPADAVVKALSFLNLNSAETPLMKSFDELRNRYYFSLPSVSMCDIRVWLVLARSGENLVPCWDVSIDVAKGSDWWNIRVNALNGEEVGRNNWTITCEQPAGVREDATHRHAPASGNRSSVSGAYNVFPVPVEAPSFGSRSLISNPHNPGASPHGWHDTNGQTGAEHTITRGNNVFAYEDANDDDLPGYSPDGGAALNFDFPLDFNLPADQNQDPAITNLFYANNMVHDILHHHGFDEAAGNFQQNNYGNGGAGNDNVLAEAQDGGGTSNANFATPDDGQSGRMQMYLWPIGGTTQGPTFAINSPSGIAGPYTISEGGFSPSFPSPITADLVLVDDGVAPTTNACDPIVNGAALAGKIVVIDRGTCTFISKVQAAEAFGALAVIIVNNTTGLFSMGGTGTVGIPAVMISQTDGNTIKAQLTAGQTVNGTLFPAPAGLSDFDACYDNGVIFHEYGHGVSNRLTGGPANSNCLINAEQGGEGWSDWLALVLTIEPGDVGSSGRGIGTYVDNQTTTGLGIRRFRYSTSPSVNSQSYGDLASSFGVHQYGEIWCSALWDLTWLLIDAEGFNSDWFNGTGGNHTAVSLVLEGMKLQPCEPGYVDARDAILAADSLLYQGVHTCLIWQAFAGRGLGVGAVQGSSDNGADQTENFTLPSFCSPTAVLTKENRSGLKVFPNPAQSELCISFPDADEEPMQISIISTLGQVTKVWNTSGRGVVRLSLDGVASGVYSLQVLQGARRISETIVVTK